MYSGEIGVPQLPEFRSLLVQTEVPVYAERFPDGRTVHVSGDTESMARSLMEGDAIRERLPASNSLLGCTQILRQFMPEFRTEDLLAYAERLSPTPLSPESWLLGAFAPEALAQTLTDFDVPAHVEQAQSSEDLAHHLESGRGVLIGVNLGELWNSAAAYGAGDANGVAVALAVARAPENGDIVGWYLNDVVARNIRIAIDSVRMQHAWLHAGGWMVVTEMVKRRVSA